VESGVKNCVSPRGHTLCDCAFGSFFRPVCNMGRRNCRRRVKSSPPLPFFSPLRTILLRFPTFSQTRAPRGFPLSSGCQVISFLFFVIFYFLFRRTIMSILLRVQVGVPASDL